ncbi:MAG: hypothetical protein IPF83_02480 [Rhodanobacteraceae bacterium]|nr:hypothetical protein [Rhodanobacteraceae bacterium]
MRWLRMMVLGGGVGMAFSTVFADASGNIGHSHGNFIAVVEACAPFTIRANGPEWRVHSTKERSPFERHAVVAFAVNLFADNGSGTAPTPAGAITPIATVAESAQTNFGTFGAGTSIFEASFVPTPGAAAAPLLPPPRPPPPPPPRGPALRWWVLQRGWGGRFVFARLLPCSV